MSSLDKSYSKEFRSYYSRSASSSANDQRSARSERPLSSRLVERDYSSPRFDWPADDRYTFDRRAKEFSDDFERRRKRFFSASFEDLMNDDDFFPSFNERKAPLSYRDKEYSSSTSRTIPVQYVPSSSYHQEKNYRKVDFATDSFDRNGRENRLPSNGWAPRQEPPTRKRTSMTIRVRQPHIQYSEVAHHLRPGGSSARTTYY